MPIIKEFIPTKECPFDDQTTWGIYRKYQYSYDNYDNLDIIDQILDIKQYSRSDRKSDLTIYPEWKAKEVRKFLKWCDNYIFLLMNYERDGYYYPLQDHVKESIVKELNSKRFKNLEVK